MESHNVSNLLHWKTPCNKGVSSPQTDIQLVVGETAAPNHDTHVSTS